jgi:ankyrin repeat protein
MLVSSKLDNQNEAHETALHIASKKNHLSIILTLLRNNSSLVLTNKIGMTAAQVALQNGHYQACEILVACGDVSLLPENIKGLPEYVKVDFVLHQAKLTAIQNILTSKMPSGILIALKLMNVDAVKLLLTIRPY